FVVYEATAKRNLDAIESELRRERHGLGIGAEFQIPVGDADAKFGIRRAEKRRGGQRAQKAAARHAAIMTQTSPPLYPNLSSMARNSASLRNGLGRSVKPFSAAKRCTRSAS